jgi:hypothetical protein
MTNGILMIPKGYAKPAVHPEHKTAPGGLRKPAQNERKQGWWTATPSTLPSPRAGSDSRPWSCALPVSQTIINRPAPPLRRGWGAVAGGYDYSPLL